MTNERGGVRAGAYPIGFFALAFLDTLFVQWAVYLHADSAHATAATARWIGVVLLVGYLLQGVANPVIGGMSDRLRHRWGRRRPLILFGTPVLALLFAGLWLASGYAGMAIIPLYCVAFALVAQPYASLLPTIAPRQRTRVRLSLGGSVLALAAAGAALVGGPALVALGSFSALAAAGFAVAWLGLFVPALVIREPAPAVAAAGRRPARALFVEARDLLAQRPLRRFLAGNTCFFAAVGMLTMIGPFVPEHLLARETSYTSVLNGWLFGGMIAAVPLVHGWARRGHAAAVMAGGAAAGAIVVAALSAMVWSEAGSVWMWWLGYGALGLTVLMALAGPPLVLSALSDRDGSHREGLFFGLNGLIALGLGRAAAAVTTGYFLGDGASAGPATGVLSCMVLASALLAAASWLLGASTRGEGTDARSSRRKGAYSRQRPATP